MIEEAGVGPIVGEKEERLRLAEDTLDETNVVG